jgi:hypothetical protein
LKAKPKVLHVNVSLGREDRRRLQHVKSKMLEEANASGDIDVKITNNTAVGYALRKCAEAMGG